MADEIYALTERGKSELQGGATSCAPRELEILVLVDGVSAGPAIAARARTVPREEVPKVLQRLAQLGLVEKAGAGGGAGYSFIGGGELLPSAAKEADAGTADLKRQGYYVSIARRAAKARALAAGAARSVLIVEDDAVLARMLGHLMTLEGFTPRVACRGAEIAAELARRPPPDLVLLDVVLPDADGFEVLAGMKGDPALRDIPVIMVTGRTTREGVMRGLAGGAAGYVTKPIQYEALANGVKSVLGLGEPPAVTPAAIGADDTLSELRREYRRSLPAKLARVEELAQAGKREELLRLAHSMAGAAPTFGLPKVGAAAKALEEALMAKDAGEAKRRVADLRTAADAA